MSTAYDGADLAEALAHAWGRAPQVHDDNVAILHPNRVRILRQRVELELQTLRVVWRGGGRREHEVLCVHVSVCACPTQTQTQTKTQAKRQPCKHTYTQTHTHTHTHTHRHTQTHTNTQTQTNTHIQTHLGRIAWQFDHGGGLAGAGVNEARALV